MKRTRRARKREWEDFEACFERRGIGSLKHFTAVENLRSIVQPPRRKERAAGVAEPGLYSRRGLQERGVTPHRLHGWGGKGQALQEYICLGFSLPAGIVRAEATAPAVLIIHREVITWEGTCFCRTNSASRNISAEEIFAASDLAAFESLFKGDYGSRLRYRQAEILVRDHIPLESIGAIWLPLTPAGQRANRLLKRLRWQRRLRGRWLFPQVRRGSWQSLV